MRRLPCAMAASVVVAIGFAFLQGSTSQAAASAASFAIIEHARVWIDHSIQPFAHSPLLLLKIPRVRRAPDDAAGGSATGQSTRLTAQTTFNDADHPVDFLQCANDDTATGGEAHVNLGKCNWIDGSLQGANSRIYEGMSTLQQFVFDNFPASSNDHIYRVRLHMDAYNGGAHAYDFPTTWDDAIDAINHIAPPGLTQSVPLYPVELKLRNAAGNTSACNRDPASLQSVCLALRHAANPYVYDVELGNIGEISSLPGDDVQGRMLAYQMRHQGPNSHKAMRVYSNQPLTQKPVLAFVGYESTSAVYDLSFQGLGADPTQLMIEFGAHLAVGQDPLTTQDLLNVGYGVGKGSASIRSPFHVSLEIVDNLLDGNGDNTSYSSQENHLANDILIAPALATLDGTPKTSGGVAILNQTVSIGTTVHDQAFIDTGDALHTIPDGSTVTFSLYSGGTCGVGGGTLLNSYPDIAVSPTGGQTGSTISPDFTPASQGRYSYLFDFVSGNGTTLLSRSGDPVADCEAFDVADANIQITPATGTNATGTNHVLTITVNVAGGGGVSPTISVAGGTATASIVSGPGTFVGSPTCSYAGGAATASCTVTITSNTAGTTVVSATSDIPINGDGSLSRTTDSTFGSSAPASKTWVTAAITITPSRATHDVGLPIAFRATVLQDTGGGLLPVGAGVPVTVTLIGSNGAIPNPEGPFNLNTNDIGEVLVIFASRTAGQVTGHATATVTVDGVSVPVSTNGMAPNSGDAFTLWVDANISIMPLTGDNPVNTDHTLTAHVNVNDGQGAGFVNSGAGTPITFSLVNSNGATATFDGPSSCLTVALTGSCSVQITSSTAGDTTINASTNVCCPGGVPLQRRTGDTIHNDGPDATKHWHTPVSSVITTTVRDGNGADITGATVKIGTVIHDEATVQKAAGTPASVPAPTGTVTFTLFNTLTCNGTVVGTTTVALVGALASSPPLSNLAPGNYSYLAVYNGDANYPPRPAGCEPVTLFGTPVRALSLGYWKNWSSCKASNGNQDPSTDRVLQQFEPTPGFVVGILVLHDVDPDPDVASDCHAVVNLLNKTAIDAGKGGGSKLARDPLFNMAAQYVAYKLNVQNGASACSAVADAAQALLVAHDFNGLTHTAVTKDQAAYANALNVLLDTANNNTGCGVPPVPPNPL